jgi:hypothetical protein
VAFDKGATDRKAHSQSFRLAGDERIEDRLETFGVNEIINPVLAELTTDH